MAARWRLRVERREHVVQDAQLARRVRGARDGDALLLAAAQRDAALADLGGVAVGQRCEVGVQLAAPQHLGVPSGVEGLAEDDVLAHGRVEDPRRLRAVGRAARCHQWAALALDHLAEHRGTQGALPRARLPHHRHQLARAHLG